ncbi:hypothetical protein TNCV_2335801 [Trichonephila clavipes]|uniref:Endonuclease/exonuclease/phosphatase domain-containing protein n=1 Tax=Trichonephila clavipes TaxID=2585209 RepID=A0A8X6SHB2_TRICX|nr:hypothetical protein TNCV_2335801 [Trichonephila clavipes]
MGTVEATSVALFYPARRRPTSHHFTVYLTQRELSAHPHRRGEALFSLGGASIICGDFNAHHTSWGCRRNDKPRQRLSKNLIDSTDTQIAPNPHLHAFGHNSASIIDIALTRNIHWLSQVESIAELSSGSQLINHFFRHKQTFRLSEANRDYRLGGLSRAPKPRPLHFPNHCAHGKTSKTQVADLTDAIINTRTLFQADSGRELLLRVGRNPTAHDRAEQSQENLAVQRDPSDAEMLNNIQNRIHRKVKAFQNKIWEDELRALDPDDDPSGKCRRN